MNSHNSVCFFFFTEKKKRNNNPFNWISFTMVIEMIPRSTSRLITITAALSHVTCKFSVVSSHTHTHRLTHTHTLSDHRTNPNLTNRLHFLADKTIHQVQWPRGSGMNSMKNSSIPELCIIYNSVVSNLPTTNQTVYSTLTGQLQPVVWIS